MASSPNLIGMRREWRYRQPVIALVTTGHVVYQTDREKRWAPTGAVIVGNAGETFVADHISEEGHSRIALFLDEAIMAEIADATGRRDPTFAASYIPPGPAGTLPAAWIRRLLNVKSPTDDLLFQLVSWLMKPVRRQDREPYPSAAEARRIYDTIREVQGNLLETWTLARLASIADMSRFHFIRRFHRLTGTTPTQYVLSSRMADAAERLAASSKPIVQIAMEAGFDDLSTFYRQFGVRFNMTPAQWRRRFS